MFSTPYRSLYDSDKVGDVNQFVLTISTTHPEAWEQYFKGLLEDADIESEDYDLTLSEKNGENFVSLTFPSFPSESSSTRLNRVCLSETVIKAEPGIGLS